MVRTDRGGDVTYHGPGQVVGYPIVTVPMGPGAIPGHVHAVEQVVIDALAELGLAGRAPRRLPGCLGRCPTGPIPARSAPSASGSAGGRSMHGFALNVDPDLAWFDRIVPCGLPDKAVTSLAAEGIDVVDGRRRRRSWPGTAGRPVGPGRRPSTARTWTQRGPTPGRRPPDSPTAATGAGWAPAHPPPSGRGRPRRGAGPGRAQARRGCGCRPGWATSSWPCAGRCGTSTWSRCARRRAVRTSSSAGPTAPPPS